MYGYELSQAIEERSGDILSLGKGTLYPLLYNLEAKKLVEAKWEDTDSGRKRRYYSITSEGKGQILLAHLSILDDDALFKVVRHEL